MRRRYRLDVCRPPMACNATEFYQAGRVVCHTLNGAQAVAAREPQLADGVQRNRDRNTLRGGGDYDGLHRPRQEPSPSGWLVSRRSADATRVDVQRHRPLPLACRLRAHAMSVKELLCRGKLAPAHSGMALVSAHQGRAGALWLRNALRAKWEEGHFSKDHHPATCDMPYAFFPERTLSRRRRCKERPNTPPTHHAQAPPCWHR